MTEDGSAVEVEVDLRRDNRWGACVGAVTYGTEHREAIPVVVQDREWETFTQNLELKAPCDDPILIQAVVAVATSGAADRSLVSRPSDGETYLPVTALDLDEAKEGRSR